MRYDTANTSEVLNYVTPLEVTIEAAKADKAVHSLLDAVNMEGEEWETASSQKLRIMENHYDLIDSIRTRYASLHEKEQSPDMARAKGFLRKLCRDATFLLNKFKKYEKPSD